MRPGDDLARKLRAFWYPPWPGAVIEVDGRRLTLVDDALLAEVAAPTAMRAGSVKCDLRHIARQVGASNLGS